MRFRWVIPHLLWFLPLFVFLAACGSGGGSSGSDRSPGSATTCVWGSSNWGGCRWGP